MSATTVEQTIANYKAVASRAAMKRDFATMQECLEGLCEVRDQLRVLTRRPGKLYKQATDTFWFVSGLIEHVTDSTVRF